MTAPPGSYDVLAAQAGSLTRHEGQEAQDRTGQDRHRPLTRVSGSAGGAGVVVADSMAVVEGRGLGSLGS